MFYVLCCVLTIAEKKQLNKLNKDRKNNQFEHSIELNKTKRCMLHSLLPRARSVYFSAWFQLNFTYFSDKHEQCIASFTFNNGFRNSMTFQFYFCFQFTIWLIFENFLQGIFYIAVIFCTAVKNVVNKFKLNSSTLWIVLSSKSHSIGQK